MCVSIIVHSILDELKPQTLICQLERILGGVGNQTPADVIIILVVSLRGHLNISNLPTLQCMVLPIEKKVIYGAGENSAMYMFHCIKCNRFMMHLNVWSNPAYPDVQTTDTSIYQAGTAPSAIIL